MSRIGKQLDGLQDPEQAGFRPDYSCSDIVMFMRMIAEKADEWGEEVWAASLDLEKAFDKVYHASVISSLSEADVTPEVLRYLLSAYRRQTAYASLDGAKSRIFDILRGVRQGDPLSPLLFNNVTRIIFRDLKQKWALEGKGTIVCGGDDLGTMKSTHSMFADGTTLFASSRSSLKAMIKDVMAALASHGLNLNLDKCLIQSTRTDLCEEFVEVDGHHIPVVAGCKGFKALGTQFTLHGRTSAELKARMGAAWGKFRALWPILGKRDGNLLKRLRLFDSCITQTALWCNESWLLTKVEKRLLRSTQNNMLRRIAGPRRKPEEQWVDWVKRSTREARHAAKKAGIRFWVESHLRSKWCWAGHVLRMSGDRLAHRSAIWRDSAWQTTEKDMPAKLRVRRPHRTRWFRWEDDLRRFADQHVSGSWQEAAQDREAWLKHVSDFIRYAA